MLYTTQLLLLLLLLKKSLSINEFIGSACFTLFSIILFAIFISSWSSLIIIIMVRLLFSISPWMCVLLSNNNNDISERKKTKSVHIHQKKKKRKKTYTKIYHTTTSNGMWLWLYLFIHLCDFCSICWSCVAVFVQKNCIHSKRISLHIAKNERKKKIHCAAHT